MSRSGLRRELDRVAAYATLLGTLVGAGIFRVTSDAWRATGPSVLLAHVLLALPVLATAVAYAAFASTSLGLSPAGEYAHLRAVFGSPRLAFTAAWLKIVSYLGAFAFLARVLADHLLVLGSSARPVADPTLVALLCLTGTYVVHAVGVRWFGRFQVALCVLLGAALLALVVPGLFAVRIEPFRPFFRHGASGFLASLPPLFFAWAGFESVVQAAGEVRDVRRTLPGVLLRGVAATAVLYVALSVVAFGVLPGRALAASATPLADVAAVYLPVGGSTFVALGAVAAVATSLNASLLVPSRLAYVLASDGFLPRALAGVHARTGTPLLALTLSYVLAALLLWTGRVRLALDIAVLALLLLYLVHSLAFLLLARRRPDLAAEVRLPIGPRLRTAAALLSILSLALVAGTQGIQDLHRVLSGPPVARWSAEGPTATELLLLWAGLGALLSLLGGRRRRPAGVGRPSA